MMTDTTRIVTGGVDTHRDVHVAAVVDDVGRILATESFAASGRGYSQLHRWMSSFGTIDKVGIEGTGSYGSGLTRWLQSNEIDVVEVNRPNRQARRRRGKSDVADAEGAARAALNGEATAVPKSSDGNVESIRMLRIARRSALKARSQAANQIHNLIVNSPDELRSQLGQLELGACVKLCSRFRTSGVANPTAAAKTALRLLSRRWQALTVELEDLDRDIETLCLNVNPALMGALGVKSDVASALLVAAGDNPDRLHSPASFAALCGVSPVEASSGKTIRHRLNTGGNRIANNALWRIAMVRLRYCTRTQAFAARKRSEGKSTKEILRILKTYISREIYWLLVNPPKVPKGNDLRDARKALGVSLDDAATALNTTKSRLSRLEREDQHNNQLATTYETWLNHAA